MAEIKTKQTDADVSEFINSFADTEQKRKDAFELLKLMEDFTGYEPKMWGPSIIGFGSYHYRYESGREGDTCATGFAARKGDISIYLTAGFPGQDELLAKLGRHKMGKACLYVRRLADVDPKVLEALVAGSVAEVRRRHG